MSAELHAIWLGIVIALVVVGWATTPIQAAKRLDANPLASVVRWARRLKRNRGER